MLVWKQVWTLGSRMERRVPGRNRAEPVLSTVDQRANLQVKLNSGCFSEQRDPSLCAEDQRFERTPLELELLTFQQRKNLEGHLKFSAAGNIRSPRACPGCWALGAVNSSGFDNLLATGLTAVTPRHGWSQVRWPSCPSGFRIRALSDRQSQQPRADTVCLVNRSINRVINS